MPGTVPENEDIVANARHASTFKELQWVGPPNNKQDDKCFSDTFETAKRAPENIKQKKRISSGWCGSVD